MVDKWQINWFYPRETIVTGHGLFRQRQWKKVGEHKIHCRSVIRFSPYSIGKLLSDQRVPCIAASNAAVVEALASSQGRKPSAWRQVASKITKIAAFLKQFELSRKEGNSSKTDVRALLTEQMRHLTDEIDTNGSYPDTVQAIFVFYR